MSAAWQSGDRSARSVWSASSLLALSEDRGWFESGSKLRALQTLRAAVQPQESAQRYSSPSDKAFTLVELVVLLAILAFGAAVLAPALARTAPVTKSVLCRSHLKQLTAAWRMYAGDNSDGLVADATGITGRPAWITGYIDYNPGNSSTWDVNRDIKLSPLWSYLRQDSTLFRCPADQTWVVMGGVRKSRVRSVSMNHAFGRGEWLEYPVWRTYSKGANVMIPAKTFLFIDEHPDSINDGSFANNCTGASQPNSTRIIDFPASYHENGGCGISFADGRAEIHRWLSPIMKPPVSGGSIVLNIPAPGAWVDIAWLAQNTTVRK